MAPDQCIRYCFEDGVTPLWPNKQQATISAEDIPCCERCGAPRRFEFQILPQLIHFLDCDESSTEDSYDWQETHAAIHASNLPEMSCRSTIVVYSCSESCNPAENLPADRQQSQAYVQEFVFVQRM